MGEAKQRRLAKAAGKPWPQDIPKPPEPYRYLGDDGQWHGLNEKRHRHDPTAIMALQMATLIAGRCRIF